MKVFVYEVVATEQEIELPVFCPKCGRPTKEGVLEVSSAMNCMTVAKEKATIIVGEPRFDYGKPSLEYAQHLPSGFLCGNCATKLVGVAPILVPLPEESQQPASTLIVGT